MIKVNFDLSDLVLQTQRLLRTMENRIEELEKQAPDVGVREYFRKLSADFIEMPFIPLDDVWEENLRKILHKFDDDEGKDKPPEE
jgi:hypothetical protein